jgi:hypothetical protein
MSGTSGRTTTLRNNAGCNHSLYGLSSMDDNAPELELVPTLTSREKGRFVNFYCKRIRPHTNKEKEGVMKLIDNARRKGMTPEQIQIALENYEQSVQGLDVRLRKHIRSFFSADSLRIWQKPLELPSQKKGGSRQQDAGLDILDKLDSLL